MKYHLLVCGLSLCVFSSSIFASKIDTVNTYSHAMRKNIKAIIIRPDSYDKKKSYPVLYLLHGHGGDYTSYVKSSAVYEAPDKYGMIIVCADGGTNSWYWDSPMDTSYRYETYIAKELIDWVDKNYSTVRNTQGRSVVGFSMGGHGALYLAIKHPDVFGACGSISGGVDIRPFPNSWDMAKHLGKYADHSHLWESHTVINMLHLIESTQLHIMVDCGTDDFFYPVNQELHRQMLLRHIAHDYISRPGGHTREYMENAIKYQILFMAQFLTEEK